MPVEVKRRRLTVARVAAIVLGCAAVLALGVFLKRSGAQPALAPEDEEQPSVVGVRTATLQRATLRGYVTAFGRVEPEPASGSMPSAHVLVTAALAGPISAT